MPIVTVTQVFTFTDNPAAHSVEKTFSCHSSFTPAVGGRVSPAQAEAVDFVMRSTKQHGMPKPDFAQIDTRAVQIANYGSTDGIDIDRVHRLRDGVVQG